MEHPTETLSLILTGAVLTVLLAVVLRALAAGRKITGRPPIPVLLFIFAKFLVVVNLAFLVMYGMRVPVYTLFVPPPALEIIALVFQATGTGWLILSVIRLNRDLIFGLSESGSHRLQTGGIFRFSRHPFYLGFLFILFSSCLFTPNFTNLVAFAGAWLLHHHIMIREEQSLEEQYGDEYREYKKTVNRYLG